MFSWLVAAFVLATLRAVEPCNEDKFKKCYQEVVCKHLNCTNLGSLSDGLYDYFINPLTESNETRFSNADAYCSLADEYSQCFGDVKAMDDCTVGKLKHIQTYLTEETPASNELFIGFYKLRKVMCLDPEIKQIVSANFHCQRSALIYEVGRIRNCQLEYQNFTKAEELSPAPLPCSDHQSAIDCQTQVFVDYCGEKSRRDLCTLQRAPKLRGITMPMPEDCELHC